MPCEEVWSDPIHGQADHCGGRDQAESATARVYEFISESQRWQESLPPMPTARSGVTVVARPSSSPKSPAIAVCGGGGGLSGDGGVTFDTVEVFCHSTSQWHAAESLPTQLWGLISATVGDTAYLLGGAFGLDSIKYCIQVHLDSLIDNAASPGTSPPQHGSLWTTVRDTPLELSCAGSMICSPSGHRWPGQQYTFSISCCSFGELIVVGGFDGEIWTRTRLPLPTKEHRLVLQGLPSLLLP